MCSLNEQGLGKGHEKGEQGQEQGQERGERGEDIEEAINVLREHSSSVSCLAVSHNRLYSASQEGNDIFCRAIEDTSASSCPPSFPCLQQLLQLEGQHEEEVEGGCVVMSVARYSDSIL